MKYYVIRHKETKEYMPEYKGGKGYSFWLADNIKANHLHHPRLITTKEKAQKIIVEWAKGTFEWVDVQRGFRPNIDPPWMQHIALHLEQRRRIRPRGRTKDMLEVVEIELKEI